MKFACKMLIIMNIFILCSCSSFHLQRDREIVEKGPEGLPPGIDLENVLTEEDVYKQSFDFWSQIKDLQNTEGLDDVIISINGENITELDIEIEKITAKQMSSSLKDRVQVLMNNIILTQEAMRQDIEPKDTDVEAFMKDTKEALLYDDGQFAGHLDAMGITEEKYIEESRLQAYKMCQRTALWDKIKKSMGKEISQYAKKQKITIHEAENHYYKNYVEDLLKHAEITFFDQEIKELMLN